MAHYILPLSRHNFSVMVHVHLLVQYCHVSANQLDTVSFLHSNNEYMGLLVIYTQSDA